MFKTACLGPLDFCHACQKRAYPHSNLFRLSSVEVLLRRMGGSMPSRSGPASDGTDSSFVFIYRIHASSVVEKNYVFRYGHDVAVFWAEDFANFGTVFAGKDF